MSNIRKYFTSRYGDDGILMEFDFGQLEVVALAFLSQDPELMQDIRDGVDLHTRSASAWLGIPESMVTADQRKKAKQMTFQLQYGAGYKSMAKKLKLKEEETKAFIEAYYKRYSVVKQWQDDNIEFVKANRVTTAKKTPKGYPIGVSFLYTPCRRVLKFYERDSNRNNRFGLPTPPTEFWPTEIKNYPVQSFATGDIVPMILGKVWRALRNSDLEAKLINTVHDSIVIDTTYACMKDVYNLVMSIMLATPEYLKQDFGIEFNVPITADCKIGKNWMEMNGILFH